MVYLPLLRWLEKQFFELNLVAGKISCFEMTNLWVLDALKTYSNISKIRLLIQTLCRNARTQMDLSKNNHFLTDEAITYIPRTEKRNSPSQR